MAVPAFSLPNPFTPLAFFPEDAAWQLTVLNYTTVGALAVFIWDVLNNLKNDYKLVTQYRIGSPTVIYLLARWSTVASLVCNAIEYTAPIGNCRQYGLQTGWLYPLAYSSTALLFFIRVRAIYHGNYFVAAFFLILWLGVLVGTSTIPWAIRAAEIGPTEYCFTGGNVPGYLAASGAITLVFDTLVYLAITWKLTRDLYIARHRSDGGAWALFTGGNLPMFSKGLLQDGQVYYLSTTSVHLLNMILFNVHSIPIAYRFILGVPTQVIMNIMACRVFRNTKFGVMFHQLSVNLPSSQMAPGTRKETSTAVTIEFTKTQERDTDVELGVMQVSGKREEL
ncbi:hypothetical protein GALMADRAFT_230017 [Galerina marginata CBS 339.88]|uniref:G-protein coupled receptors family 1 profile domain-containing protein n=1 Tax=Galerina marginata (strain CBS 339.88) TaxID=685588 RepID=A0A067SVD0_GALM3|nr:hypothetical protein GALMADRAFT_230017 [Galerina marginata CBS 339.88]